ncbi:ribosomal protein S18 acetylase RimI-like enzyme [Nocardioides daedukensis]|uniref:Ribosomal protein S18 acetylase RimI-like enzyme n=1 Tax=Nocardioides daedukensis TaxID=634462 RepID=A0A7Y9UVQ8_9ACTN|nr:GNAT family N-acetyltransferase [Nocardioides daedukensis]NYG58470.1 ribosomal protein S18 acetylase RimI-like enzyme [Nocardioides daedukensis]
MTIRPVTDADWAQIWPFWIETVLAGETYAYPIELTSEQAQALWVEQPPGATVVLEEDGVVLGTAKMGPNRPSFGDHIGTASFIVSPAARGRGVGRRLGEHVVAWHRENGFRGIQFNAVVETNTAAVRLWQSLGFEIVGTVPGAFRSTAHGFVGLHVMFCDLTSDSAR